MRQRRAGVWEIRVVVANDPVTGRSVQRSFTVHGDAEVAEARRRDLVERFGVHRAALCCAGARLSVGELLEEWARADHSWRPATFSSSPSVVRFIQSDRLGRTGLVALSPAVVETAFRWWRASGASVASVTTIRARWAVLHSALAWALAERILRRNPVEGMRGPPRPQPRTHLRVSEIAALLAAAETLVEAAEQKVCARPHDRGCLERLSVADQTRLLVRLAADSGARRGELAVLRLSDLEGRVLSIERNLSLEVLGPTKSSRNRRLTLGSTTAAMVHEHFEAWQQRVGAEAVEGDWVFAPDYRRLTHARPICCRIASNGSATLRTCPRPPCTGFATAWVPSSSPGARSSRPRLASATVTRPRRCGTTPTPYPSTTRTSPTRSTTC
jgi:integrase